MWLLVVMRDQTLFLVSLVYHKVQCSDRCCYHCMLLTVCYADNIRIAFHLRYIDSLSQLITCTDDVARCFLEYGLLLNPFKTEAVVFIPAFTLRSVGLASLEVLRWLAPDFSFLGVELHEALSIDRHVSSVVITGNYHIRALRHIDHV